LALLRFLRALTCGYRRKCNYRGLSSGLASTFVYFTLFALFSSLSNADAFPSPAHNGKHISVSAAPQEARLERREFLSFRKTGSVGYDVHFKAALHVVALPTGPNEGRRRRYDEHRIDESEFIRSEASKLELKQGRTSTAAKLQIEEAVRHIIQQSKCLSLERPEANTTIYRALRTFGANYVSGVIEVCYPSSLTARDKRWMIPRRRM
jgi:hypothetical protein